MSRFMSECSAPTQRIRSAYARSTSDSRSSDDLHVYNKKDVTMPLNETIEKTDQ